MHFTALHNFEVHHPSQMPFQPLDMEGNARALRNGQCFEQAFQTVPLPELSDSGAGKGAGIVRRNGV